MTSDWHLFRALILVIAKKTIGSGSANSVQGETLARLHENDHLVQNVNWLARVLNLIIYRSRWPVYFQELFRGLWCITNNLSILLSHLDVALSHAWIFHYFRFLRKTDNFFLIPYITIGTKRKDDSGNKWKLKSCGLLFLIRKSKLVHLTCCTKMLATGKAIRRYSTYMYSVFTWIEVEVLYLYTTANS